MRLLHYCNRSPLQRQDFVFLVSKAGDTSWDLTSLSTFDSKYLGRGHQSKPGHPSTSPLIVKDFKMMRNTDKIQGEEGSVHSSPSRYDLSTLLCFLINLIPLFTFGQLWVYAHENVEYVYFDAFVSFIQE